MIKYDAFFKTIKNKNISTYNLINDYGFSKGLIDNLKHNRSITITTLNDICSKLDIGIDDVLTYVKEEKKDNKFKFFNFKN